MAYNLKFAERIRTEMKGLPVIEKKMVEPEMYKTAKQLVVIDSCGHFPMYEKFDEYIAPLKEFLKQT